MRILHTGDWHLADRLGRIDRTSDLRKAVERVADYCRTEAVELLLVAGDLFSELAGAEALRDSIRHLQEVFSGFLRDGGTILAITGNHDKENFCQTLRHAMSLAAPLGDSPGEVIPPGRLYLATEPALVRVADRESGVPVQFVLMPYPTPTRYLTDDISQRYTGLDEKNRVLMDAFTKTLHDLREGETFSPELPAVLAAHIAVRGCDLGRLFRLSETEDVVFSDEALLTGFHYTALGHIHRAQAIGGQPHVRYSGSIERMDLGEKDDDKGVVLFDIGPEGLRETPWTLPVESTPVYEVTIENPSEEIPELKRRYPDAKNHLVRVVCTYAAGVDNREELLRDLEEIFPRWYHREVREAGGLGGTLVIGEPTRSLTFEETVRDYLTRELDNEDEALRTRVLERVEALMKEVQA